MTLPWSGPLAGQMHEHVVASRALEGNPLGDPTERPLWVYVPPGYDPDGDEGLPSIYVIQGYTGSALCTTRRASSRFSWE